jgi:hypothetical protein
MAFVLEIAVGWAGCLRGHLQKDSSPGAVKCELCAGTLTDGWKYREAPVTAGRIANPSYGFQRSRRDGLSIRPKGAPSVPRIALDLLGGFLERFANLAKLAAVDAPALALDHGQEVADLLGRGRVADVVAVRAVGRC